MYDVLMVNYICKFHTHNLLATSRVDQYLVEQGTCQINGNNKIYIRNRLFVIYISYELGLITETLKAFHTY